MRNTFKINKKKATRNNGGTPASHVTTAKKKTQPSSLTVSHGGIPVGRHKDGATHDYSQSNQPSDPSSKKNKKQIFGVIQKVSIDLPEEEKVAHPDTPSMELSQTFNQTLTDDGTDDLRQNKTVKNVVTEETPVKANVKAGTAVQFEGMSTDPVGWNKEELDKAKEADETETP